jgi:exopolysaccharide biosynthesis predicted pyruvyltransferase EpsI
VVNLAAANPAKSACFVLPPCFFIDTQLSFFYLVHNDTMTTLKDILTSYREKPWYFVGSGGNWGDELIYLGGERLADSLGLQRTTLSHKEFMAADLPDGACIYIHGGGGLNPWCSGNAFKNLSKATQTPQAIVVQAPQTGGVEAEETVGLLNAALANSHCEVLHFFGRERTSYDFFKTVLPSWVNVYIDHDTAFHLSKQDLLGYIDLQEVPTGSYDFLVNRQDNEAPEQTLFYKNAITLDPAYFAVDFKHWLRLHAYASKITTNRLHSAIASVILGKTVEVLNGNYHKNRSIFEYSLIDKPNAKWLDALPDPGNDRSVDLYGIKIPGFLAKSWKVQMLIMRARGVPRK